MKNSSGNRFNFVRDNQTQHQATIVCVRCVWRLWCLVNRKIGAAAYDAAHTTLVYGGLAAYGYLSGFSVVLAPGLIELTHVGFDRLPGYGLKYPLGFGDTHLGGVGKAAQ